MAVDLNRWSLIGTSAVMNNSMGAFYSVHVLTVQILECGS